MNPWSKWLIPAFIIVVPLSACRQADSRPPAEGSEQPQATESEARPMMGPGSGMMARHHATIPAEYSGLRNPVEAGDDSLARGAEIYAGQCATCHGDEGMGDGPGGASLDPLPAPLAHTGRMLADDYLFWRISEGGAMAPFNSAMPAWKASLEESERWDLVNHLRFLSGGRPGPGPFDAQAEAEKRAGMLAKALNDGLITEEEAALFDAVHADMDALLAGQPMGPGGMMGAGQSDVLAELVAKGSFTEEQIQAFNVIHDRLLAAELMGE
ncbi:MAG: cytochrome c [Chloroflexota bacterium]|nr:MAG: cytochrome c [Chloroflexota bacterium]